MRIFFNVYKISNQKRFKIVIKYRIEKQTKITALKPVTVLCKWSSLPDGIVELGQEVRHPRTEVQDHPCRLY